MEYNKIHNITPQTIQKSIRDTIKASYVEDIQEEYKLDNLQYIDLGSGMYGKLDPELQEQFGHTPSFSDYASAVAGEMAKYYSNQVKKPMLITEPGTTIVSKYFHVFMSVLDIKEIRGKYFALLDGSSIMLEKFVA